MARTESHREDLMREATALRIRGEFRVPRWDDPVIAGCRDNGCWSIYFGPDPCYHFNERGELRRAFVNDRLYRTQGGTLAELQRVRSDDATYLMRQDLEATRLEAFLNDMRQRLHVLLAALQDGTADCMQTVPEDTDVTGALTRFLIDVTDAPIALAPAIKARSQ